MGKAQPCVRRFNGLQTQEEGGMVRELRQMIKQCLNLQYPGKITGWVSSRPSRQAQSSKTNHWTLPLGVDREPDIVRDLGLGQRGEAQASMLPVEGT